MFQFLRRLSGSFLPRPDRPWRDDATSHAPTIGCKRRHSVTEYDDDESPSAAKRSKSDDHTDRDSASEGESPDADAAPPVDGQEVKEVTAGVKEVDIEDKGEAQSSRPEGIPLPDSPTPSPEPEPASLDTGEETRDQEHADDKDSLASSVNKEDGTNDDDGLESETKAVNTDVTADGTAPASDVTTTLVQDGSIDEPLEVKT